MAGNWETCCEGINESVRKRRILLCSLFWILIFVAFAIRVIIYYHNSSNVQPSNDTSKAYDFLLFVQGWPVTHCITYAGKHDNPADKCNIPKTDDRPNWTVHGIWPSRSNSTSPVNCYLIPFNVTHLEPILNELSVNWISTEKTDSNSTVSFWEHEWCKHGTCGVQIEQINTQLKYFRQGLDWYKRYNVGKTLDSCDIRSDDSKLYTNAQVVDCVKKHYDVTPQISCRFDEIRNKQLLNEVKLCFDKTLNLRSCDIFTRQKLCKGDFIYPASVELKM